MGVGTEIEAGGRGFDTFMARLQNMSEGPLLARRAKKEVEAARKKAEGSVSLLEDLGLEVGDHERRALAYSALSNIRGFENIEETVRMADLGDGQGVDDIEDEWLHEFAESAKGAYSEWKRFALANGLSAKAADPRSFPIDALNAISRMELRDMEAFGRLCSLCPKDEDGAVRNDPVIPCDYTGCLAVVGLSEGHMRRFVELGLVVERRELKTIPATDRSSWEPGRFSSMPYDVEDGRRVAEIDFGDVRAKMRVLNVGRKTPHSDNRKLVVVLGKHELTSAGFGIARTLDAPTPENVQFFLDTSCEQLACEMREERGPSLFEKRDFERAVKKISRDASKR